MGLQGLRGDAGQWESPPRLQAGQARVRWLLRGRPVGGDNLVLAEGESEAQARVLRTFRSSSEALTNISLILEMGSQRQILLIFHARSPSSSSCCYPQHLTATLCAVFTIYKVHSLQIPRDPQKALCGM